jgi:hypothetical protein
VSVNVPASANVTVVVAALAVPNVTPAAGSEVHATVGVVPSGSVALAVTVTLFVGSWID